MALASPAEPEPSGPGYRTFAPYLPRLVVDWVGTTPELQHRSVDGTLVFVDISGFTKLSEGLAVHGKIGAEELAAIINECFVGLLAVAYADGAQLLKFGGDALLLLFSGPENERRACRAAFAMRRHLRATGKLNVLGQRVTLRMSIGLNSGQFDMFLVGRSHRELVVTGPAASTTVSMESTATAGEILVSAADSPCAASGRCRRAAGRRLPPAARAERVRQCSRAAPSRGSAGRPGPMHPHGHPPLDGRDRARARAPPGRRRIRALRRHRRNVEIAGPRGDDRISRLSCRRRPGGGRPARGHLHRHRHRPRRRQGHPRRRRPAGHRRGRAPHAAGPPPNHGPSPDPAPAGRRQQRPRVRRRHRPAVPAHLHGHGGHREPGRAADGQGGTGNHPGHARGPGPLRLPVRDERGAALPGEGQGDVRSKQSKWASGSACARRTPASSCPWSAGRRK